MPSKNSTTLTTRNRGSPTRAARAAAAEIASPSTISAPGNVLEMWTSLMPREIELRPFQVSKSSSFSLL